MFVLGNHTFPTASLSPHLSLLSYIISALGVVTHFHNSLIKYTVETIRTRLDRLYLEALEASISIASTNGGADSGDVSALQEELESLYSEILPVAQMSVEEQYLGPALKSHASQNEKGLLRSAKAMDYVNQTISSNQIPPPADLMTRSINVWITSSTESTGCPPVSRHSKNTAKPPGS